VSAFLPEDIVSVTVVGGSAYAGAGTEDKTRADAKACANGAEGIIDALTDDAASAVGGDHAAANAAGKSTGESIMAMICRSLTHAGLQHRLTQRVTLASEALPSASILGEERLLSPPFACLSCTHCVPLCKLLALARPPHPLASRKRRDRASALRHRCAKERIGEVQNSVSTLFFVFSGNMSKKALTDNQPEFCCCSQVKMSLCFACIGRYV
jgi:hypothetical protein